jgi:hypothetical protein
MVVLAYVGWLILNRIAKVGMPRSSESVSESRQRGMFIENYSVISSSKLVKEMKLHSAWLEYYYRTPSIDLSKSEIIEGNYQLHIFSNDSLVKLLSDEHLFIKLGNNLLQPFKDRDIISVFSRDAIPDTIVASLYLRNPLFYDEISSIDSFKLVRVK